MWFGTTDGLNRFDGHDFVVYKYDPDDYNTISDNFVRCMIEDNKKRLWIGTDAGGLNVLDTETEKFRRVSFYGSSDSTIQNRQIWDLYIDNLSRVWIATWDGLYSLDLDDSTYTATIVSDQIKQIRCLSITNDQQIWMGSENDGLFKYVDSVIYHEAINPNATDQRIYSLLDDTNNGVWLGTHEGLFHYNAETKSYSRAPFPITSLGLEVISITRGRDKELWVGTANDGLFLYNYEKGQFKNFKPAKDDVYGLRDSGILDIHLDSNGLLWLASRGDGIQFFDTKAPFSYYYIQPKDPSTKNNPSVRAIFADDQELWVGGYNGLSWFSATSSASKHFDEKSSSLSNRNVYALLKDSSGTLWVGTEGGGLFFKRKDTEKFVHLKIVQDETVKAEYVFELFLSNDRSLYIGTGGGLYRLKADHNYTDSPEKVRLGNGSTYALEAEEVMAISEDSQGNLYIGTASAGMFLLDPNHELVAHYTHNNSDRNSISNDRIKVLHFDQHGSLWIGTNGGGLNKFDQKSEIFYHYNENDGLSDNTVYGILEDKRGRLWLSSNQGVSLFDQTDLSVKNFGVEHGLQSLEFNTGAYFQSKSGKMYFGGIKGINAFLPEEVTTRPRRLSVTLTNVKVSNKKVEIGSPLLAQDLNALEALSLTYKERLLSFEFSGMNFLSPAKTRYRYMIPGVDDHWIYTDKGQHIATYTDLPAGTHELRIQAAQSPTDFVGKVRSLTIQKTPAPWNSALARAATLGLILVILYLIRQNEIKKMMLRVELKKKKQETQKLNEIDEMKYRLISNVSHELRTPLTLLAGHIENLSKAVGKNMTPQGKASLQDAQHGLKRVIYLSDQLFELARFSSGKIKLKASKQDLTIILKRISEEFKAASSSNNKEVIFLNGGVPIEVFVDTGKFEQILFNLLSNALKFSNKKSKITIELYDDQRSNEGGQGSFAVIRVSNFGRVIPPSALSNIFERLYQIDSDRGDDQGGAGIGLALVKELVELHGGSISVTSDPQGETRFEFTIPKGSDHLSAEEIVDAPEKQTPMAVIDSGHTKVNPTQLKILIVEDDSELSAFIKQGLKKDYTIILAKDGVSGLELARKELPDLILSDVNMPNKDGIQLLRDVREDLVLSHVPVILLTGQTSPQDRIRGYAALANDYIGKPFKMDELKVRIESLFRSRQQLINKLKENGLQRLVSESNLSKIDDRFFTKLKEVIETHLNKSELSVEELAKKVFMSKRQLERKIKDITGQSPAGLIRQTRLETARNYLMDGSFGTVAEVAYAVGFNNVKYFSRLFHNQFGKTPHDILKN